MVSPLSRDGVTARRARIIHPMSNCLARHAENVPPPHLSTPSVFFLPSALFFSSLCGFKKINILLSRCQANASYEDGVAGGGSQREFQRRGRDACFSILRLTRFTNIKTKRGESGSRDLLTPVEEINMNMKCEHSNTRRATTYLDSFNKRTMSPFSG